jgi:hypothetical protein
VTDRPPAADPAEDLPLEDIVEVQGDAPPSEQDAVITPHEMERSRTPTRTELDQGDPIPDPRIDGDVTSLDGLELDQLREDETHDPGVATQEGIPYVPPVDPPVRSDPEADDGVVVAAGLGLAADDEPYDQNHRGTDETPEPELRARIREALRADSLTSTFEDRLIVGTRGSVAVIRGVVDDIDDGDSITEVVLRVDGITEVVDETELAG